jgi:N utilization substance protein A
MDIAAESRRAVSELFGDAEEYSEEFSRISELPGVDQELAAVLKEGNVEFIEDFLALTPEQLEEFKEVGPEKFEALRKLIEENVEIIEEIEEEEEGAEAGTAEEGAGEAEEEPEEYECPECGAKITVDMTACPNCGIGLSFEYEEDEE